MIPNLKRGLALGGLLLSLGVLSCTASGESHPDAVSSAGRADPDAGAPITAVPPDQPFHFDHRIHAGQYQIPCLTCHGFADKGPTAGIPTTDKCIGCHRFVAKDKPEVKRLTQAVEDGTPVAWNRVHRLPDHVFFDHSAHVLAGVTCQTCHGAVEKMAQVHQVAPLTMGWCVQCHRDNHAPVQDCTVCHK